MKWLQFVLLLVFAGLISCNNQGTRGIQCSKGKGRKAKTYRIKKMQSYPRGYQVSRGSSPTNNTAKKEKQTDTLTTEQAFNDTVELEGFPPKKATLQADSVQINVFQIPQNQEIDKDDKEKRDTIYKRTVERRTISKPETTVDQTSPKETVNNPQKDTIYRKTIIRQTTTSPTEQTQKPKDTTYRTSTVRIKQQPEPEPQLPETKDTLFTQTVIRQVNVPLLESLNPKWLNSKINADKIEFELDTVTQLMFKNHVFEKDEDFEYYLNIPFVPNFDIVLYPNQAEKELKELVSLLKEHPQKKVYIYGNGGRDDADELTPFELNYWQDPNSGNHTRIYYGKNIDVYQQTFNGFGNIDPHELSRIKEEGRKELNGDEYINIGSLLHARAKTIEDYLVAKGINRDRIIPKRGEFLPRPNATVKIKVFNE